MWLLQEYGKNIRISHACRCIALICLTVAQTFFCFRGSGQATVQSWTEVMSGGTKVAAYSAEFCIL